MSKKKKKDFKKIDTISATENKKIGLGYIIASIFVILGSYFVLKSYLSKFPFDLELFFELINPFNYFSSNISKTLLYNTKEILKLVLFFISILGLGEVFNIIIFKKIEVNELEKFILSYAFGLSFILLFTIITGFFGFINKSLYRGFACMGFLSFFYSLITKKIRFKEAIKEIKKSNKIILITFLIFSIINLIQALGPEIFYDTYVYHLGVPSYWSVNDRLIDCPYNIYSKLSLNHSVIYLFAMKVFGNQSPILINFLTSIFCFLSISWLFQKEFGSKISMLGGIIFYTIFHVLVSSQSATSDIMAEFPSIIAFYFALRYIDLNSNLFILITGVFSGFAFGVKYNTAFLIISYLIILMYKSYKDNKNLFGIIKVIGIFSIGFSIFSAPWLIKNWIKYSNPLFPFLFKILNKNLSEIDVSKISAFMIEVRQYAKFNFIEWLKNPFLISTGKIINSEFFSFIFIIILPLGIFFKARNRKIRYLWFSFIFSWLFWSLSSTNIRHMFSSFFLISLLSSYYLNLTYGFLNFVLKFLLGFSIILTLNWIMSSFKFEERYKPVLGIEDRDEWLSYSHPRYPDPSYSLIKYINENLDDKSKVLFLSEPKVYYIDKKFESSSVFDRNPLVDAVMESNNGDEVYEKLKKIGFTHILANIYEIVRVNKDYNIFYWGEKDLGKFNDFFNKHMKIEKDFEKIRDNKVTEKSVLYKIVENKKNIEPNLISQAIEISIKRN